MINPKRSTYCVASSVAGCVYFSLTMIALVLPCTGAHATMGFSFPAALNTNAATDSGNDFFPQITTDGAGHWVAVWFSGDTLGGTIGSDDDILISRSTDSGATWTPTAALNTNAATDSGHDRSPQVTNDGAGHWVAVWSSAENLGGTIGTDLDILVSRSLDNGATWTAPEALNTNAATDSGDDLSPQVTTDHTGHWVAVWMSEDTLGGTIGIDPDILVSRSTDNGATWTAPAALNTNAAIDSGDDLVPQVATDGVGHWVTVWYSTDDLGGTIDTDYDILVSRSLDNGAIWTAPAALNTNAAGDWGDDNRCQITTDGAGHWVTVWSSSEDLGGTTGTDWDILVSRSVDNGATWTAPAALNTNAATDSGYDTAPQVTTDGAGHWVAVWYSDDSLNGTIGTDRDILVSRSMDNGATWTAPEALNTNAATDSGSDYNPDVTTDGAGHWAAVWFSGDTLGGTIGTDYDILFAAMDRVTDSDHDGIADTSETNTGIYLDAWDTGSNPASKDSDADELPDGWEVSNNLDPNDDGSGDPDNGPSGDPDNDGYSNLDEFTANSDPQDDTSFPVPMPAMGLLGFMTTGLTLAALGLNGLRRRR